MNNGFLLFKNEASALLDQYLTFNYVENEEGVPALAGMLLLTDDQGKEIDRYQIKIVCSPDYPATFPLVYETAGRIPINIDWHVFADGHACICSIPEEIIACSKGIKLGSFIEDYVQPYFFNQKHREMHGFFLKERAHGQFGNLQFFMEVFKTKDLRHILNILTYIKSNPEPNRVQDCFCGSGKKYRKCHREVFQLFKPLPIQVLNKFIQFIDSFKHKNM